MAHDHVGHQSATYNTAFAVGVGLNLTFVVVELVYGKRSHSLALVADAGHNFSDVIGLVLAWSASVLGRMRPTAGRTYGFRRLSILASLVNAVLLLVVTGAIAWEALLRVAAPGAVAGRTVMVVAGIGVVINASTAVLFWSGRKRDLNLRGAFLHLASDAVIALAVVVTGLLIWKTGWRWLDPTISLVVGVVILAGTWSLLRDSVGLAIDAVPAGVDIQQVRALLAGLDGVIAVHDLHVWAMSTTEVALTAHLVIPKPVDDEFLSHASHDLHDRFEIAHVALQVERASTGKGCAVSVGSCE